MPRQADGGGGVSTAAGPSTLTRLMYAIGQHESGGSYSAVNSSSGALGKYQVLPSNVPSWTKQALGYSLTPQQFLHSPGAQEKTVAKIMGGYLRQYGVAGTIAAWYGGPGVARNQSSWNQPVPGGPTIRQYVDDIMARMGMPGAGGKPGTPYRNPLRAVRGLVAERVDMGVDYAGTGPVFAPGPGVITEADQAWAGGQGTGPGWFISERLSSGPLKGRSVYFAEHITPSVRPGQRVTTATQIGTMAGGIETGFAAGPSSPGTTLAAETGQVPASGDPGAHPTAFGAAWSTILSRLGAPAGVQPQGSSPVGDIPGWLQRAIGVIFPGVGAEQATQGGLGALVGWLQQLDTAITWLLNPSNWIRIISGVTGGVMVLSGIFVLSGLQARTTAAVPLIGGSVSEAQSSVRLPVGIFLVGAGGVLLFIAFHNLPANLTFPEFLGYEKEQVQASASGGKVAA